MVGTDRLNVPAIRHFQSLVQVCSGFKFKLKFNARAGGGVSFEAPERGRGGGGVLGKGLS